MQLEHQLEVLRLHIHLINCTIARRSNHPVLHLQLNDPLLTINQLSVSTRKCLLAGTFRIEPSSGHCRNACGRDTTAAVRIRKRRRAR